MTIISRKEMPYRKIEIDLAGSDGNAFVLIGYGKRLAKDLGYDYEPIREKMMSGDYDNLIKVFDEYFGDLVIMYK